MEIRTRDGIKGGPVRYGERGEWVAAGCRCRCGVQDVKTFKLCGRDSGGEDVTGWCLAIPAAGFPVRHARRGAGKSRFSDEMGT
jgi:hypothetical protein